MTDKKKQMLFVGIGTITGAVMGATMAFMSVACLNKIKERLELSINENPYTIVFGLFYCLYIIRCK